MLAKHALDKANRPVRLENIPSAALRNRRLPGVPTYYPGVASINSAKAVVVEAGGTTTGIDFTTAVSAGVTVEGRVIIPSGQSVPTNLKVSLGRPSAARSRERVTPTDRLMSHGFDPATTR